MTHMDETKVQPLVENHRAFLRFLERRVGSREEAEDILQEAFGRSLEKLDGLGDGESIVRWFYRVLRNAAIDHYRRKAAAGRALEAFAGSLNAAVPPPEVQNEICGCVRTLAETLKPEYAAALQEIDVEGRRRAEMYQGEALRKQVVRSCGTCAEHGCLDCTCGQPRASHAS